MNENLLINTSEDIINCLGEFRLSLLIANVLVQESPHQLKQLLFSKTEEIRQNLTLDTINQRKNIFETRQAYKKCGNDPNRYRPSAESLLRRIVKGNELYLINNIVDSLNLTSITSGVSIGGYDLDKINGTITFGIGKPGELYAGIGRGPLNITCLPVLRDETGAFGTPTSDSERTSITGNTNRVLFVFFDFSHDPEMKWLNDCDLLLQSYCNASILNINTISFM